MSTRTTLMVTQVGEDHDILERTDYTNISDAVQGFRNAHSKHMVAVGRGEVSILLIYHKHWDEE